MIAKVDATATNARQTGATLATECMIRNANKRVSVVAFARFRCRFCTKSLLSLLLRLTCKRFRDRKSLQFAYKKQIRKSRARDVRRAAIASAQFGAPDVARGVPSSLALAWTKASLTLRATSRQLRGACGSPAVRRECAKTENAARMSACGPRSSFEVCVCEKNSTQTLS